MHIFVINLKEDLARRIAIEKQLQELGLTCEIFPAIRGKLLSNDEKALNYDEKWFFRHEGRVMRPGELGCSLSHIGIYRLILKRNISHALILEDDAWLNPNLPNLLQAIETKYSSKENSVFMLTWFMAISSKNFENLWSSYNVADVKSAVCTHGYVVSNAAASSLIEVLYPVKHVADCWDWLQRHGILRIRAVFPTCITANLSFSSEIVTENSLNKVNRSLMVSLSHKVYRVYWIMYDRLMAVMHRVGIST